MKFVENTVKDVENKRFERILHKKKNQILKFDERPVVLNIGITHKVVLSLESRK